MNLVLGGIAGWLAGKIMKSEGGIIRNVIIGIVGGIVGSVLLGIIGIGGSGIIGGLIVSVFGACLLIWVVDKFFKK